MLVLTRKPFENINLYTSLGEKITITVTHIDQRGSVQLGITAPRTTRIVREELEGKGRSSRAL